MNAKRSGLLVSLACLALVGAGCSDRTSDKVVQSGSTPMNSTAVAPKPMATTPGSPVTTSLEDTALTASVKAALVAEPGLKSMPIEVSTTGSVVTLSGTVQSTTERSKAVQVAEAVKGVKSVVDNLAAKS